MSTWPAICSAIAAGFSAITAFFAFCIQRRFALDSIRPQLVLNDWATEHERKRGIIVVKKIKNFGHGPALSVKAHIKPRGEPLYYPFISTNEITAVRSGEEHNVDWTFLLANAFPDELENGFPDIKKKGDVSFQLVLCYWDLRNYRYDQILTLIDYEPKSQVISGFEKLAPGLFLIRQNTVVRPMWRVSLICKWQKAWWHMTRKVKPIAKVVTKRINNHEPRN